MKLKSICSIFILLFVFGGLGFTETFETELYVGQTLGLRSKIITESGIEVDEDVIWSTSDSSVASVKEGIITAKSKGDVTIKASVEEGASIRDFTVYIRVKSTVKSVELNVPKDTIYVGEYITADYTIVPVSNLPLPAHEKVTFKSSDSAIFTVDKDGLIYGKSRGSAYLSIETEDGKRKQSQKITVESMVTKIKIDQSPLTIYVGEKTSLSASITPENALNKNFSWSSTSKLEVSKEGQVTGLAEGIGFVSVTSDDGSKKDSIKIEVKSMVKGIKILGGEALIDDDHEKHQLSAELIPKIDDVPPIEDGVTWSSNKTHVATVSSNGLVTGKLNGYVNITATSVDGKYTDTTTIRVNITGKNDVYPESIQFVNPPDRAFVGETLFFMYDIDPEDITEDRLDIDIYGGDGELNKEDGLIEFTPYDEGRYTIVMETENDLRISSTFSVQSCLEGIDALPGSLLKGKTSGRYSIYLGQTGSLDHKLLQSKFAPSILIEDVNWSSGDTGIISIDSDGSYTAKSVGETYLLVRSKDSNFQDVISIEVLPMASSVSLPAYAEVGLKMEYHPLPFFTPVKDLYYGYNDVLNQEYEIEIEILYVSEAFLKSEKDYEVKRQKRINDLIKNDFGSEEDLREELNDSKDRVTDIRSFLSSDNSDFVKINYNDKTLLGRDFKTLDIAQIKNNAFIASFVCKADLKIITEDGELEDTMTVFADSEVSELLVYDESGNLISYNTGVDPKTSQIQTQNAKAEATLTAEEDYQSIIDALKSNYAGLTPSQMPSDNAILAVEESRSFNLVQSNFEDDFKRNITRLEMVKLCIGILDIYVEDGITSYPFNYFTDTNDNNVTKAYQYGIVSASSDRLFNPNETITREEMTYMLYKTLIATEKSLDSERAPERGDYFKDEDQISTMYQKAVGQLSYSHTVVTGITDDMFWPQTNCQIESALVYAMNLIRSIE